MTTSQRQSCRNWGRHLSNPLSKVGTTSPLIHFNSISYMLGVQGVARGLLKISLAYWHTGTLFQGNPKAGITLLSMGFTLFWHKYTGEHHSGLLIQVFGDCQGVIMAWFKYARRKRRRAQAGTWHGLAFWNSSSILEPLQAKCFIRLLRCLCPCFTRKKKKKKHRLRIPCRLTEASATYSYLYTWLACVCLPRNLYNYQTQLVVQQY